MKKLKVLLVDDQKLFVESLRRALLSVAPDLVEISIALDGDTAVKGVEADPPDIVLMDVHMPGTNGVEAVKRIRALRPEVKVVMLSAFGYDEYVQKSIANGASGYLLKDISPEEVLDAIQSVRNDGPLVISREIVDQTTLSASKRRDHRAQGVPRWYLELTEKERKVLFLLARGYSNDEIAERLNLGGQTTRNYVSTIYSKLGVDNRFEAMRMAIEARLDSLPM